MNYRHAFHAGNHADVLKHSVLALILTRMTAKPKPLVVIDAFAGAGRYDLALDDRASRTGEAEAGALRALVGETPAPLAPYAAAVAALNAAGAHRILPGSPLVIRHHLRPGDKFFGVELHPEEFARLSQLFDGDRSAKLFQQDGWAALKSFLPPTPKRGLVLIDPPFERPGEFDRLAGALKDGLRRWATGVFILWHPVKDRAAVERYLAAATTAAGETPLMHLELAVAPEAVGRLIGSGLIVANPPYGLEEDLAALGPILTSRLAAPEARGWSMDWRVEPR